MALIQGQKIIHTGSVVEKLTWTWMEIPPKAGNPPFPVQERQCQPKFTSYS